MTGGPKRRSLKAFKIIVLQIDFGIGYEIAALKGLGCKVFSNDSVAAGGFGWIKISVCDFKQFARRDAAIRQRGHDTEAGCDKFADLRALINDFFSQ